MNSGPPPAPRRHIVVGISLLAQLCIGGIYAWSEFVPGLCSQYGLTIAQTQAMFGTAIGTFTVVMVLAGRLLEHHGPRRLMIVGGLLLGASYVGASYSGGRFWPMFAASGLVGGAGIGLCYLCPLTVCLSLFPQRKGAMTGLVIGAFGAGAVVLSNAVQPSLAAGADVLLVLRVVGFAYGAVVVLSALALPARIQRVAQPDQRAAPARGLLRQPSVWLHATGMFCGTFAGLMIIGNIRPLALSAGTDELQAALAVSAMGIGNAAGRLGWGAVSDRLGWRSVPLSMGTLAVAVSLLLPAAAYGPAFTLVTVAVAIGFGSCFVLHAALIAARWGTAALATAYPVVFLAYGLAGLLGPPIGGRIYDATGSYSWAIGLAAAIAVVGAGATCGLRACSQAEGRAEERRTAT